MFRLLKLHEAATVLGVSARQLWSQTQPRGPICCVRIGHNVRYSQKALEDFTEAQEQSSAQVTNP